MMGLEQWGLAEHLSLHVGSLGFLLSFFFLSSDFISVPFSVVVVTLTLVFCSSCSPSFS